MKKRTLFVSGKYFRRSDGVLVIRRVVRPETWQSEPEA